MTVSVKAACHRAQAERMSGFNFKSQSGGKIPLKDATSCSRIYVCIGSNFLNADPQFDGKEDGTRSIVVKGHER